jgi:hypothetical protein
MIVNGFKSKAAALRAIREAGLDVRYLLSKPDANPKLAKNAKHNVLSLPLHLAPFNLSGFQVCPQASAGCAAACLHTAGNPAAMAGKDHARKERTKAYFKCRDAFMAVLVFEIQSLCAKAMKLGMKPGVRLNATSDLPWERRTVNIGGHEQLLMDAFPEVQFYDYTKVHKRAMAHARGQMPVNYHLTYSKTEDNDPEVAKVFTAGGNVSVVMSPERYKEAVRVGKALVCGEIVPVFDGDAHDYRPVEGMSGAAIVLKAKGDARHDTSGFVVR